MDGTYICLYSVIYHDDSGENKEDFGMIFADSFASAAEYLEKVLYGEDLIEITHMELLDTCPIFTKETWDIMRKELNNL